MAHFAKLDENNTVLEIHCIANSELLDENGNESEAKGVEFLINWSGGYTNWKQTSYNNNFRKRYAFIGGSYDAQRDAFINPKPFASWVFDEVTYEWQAPKPYPEGNTRRGYAWDEATLSWVVGAVEDEIYAIDHDGRSIGDMPVTTVGGSNA